MGACAIRNPRGSNMRATCSACLAYVALEAIRIFFAGCRRCICLVHLYMNLVV